MKRLVFTREPSTASFASWPVRMLQRVVDGSLVRASASHPSNEGRSAASDEAAVMEARRPSRFTTQVRLHRDDPTTGPRPITRRAYLGRLALYLYEMVVLLIVVSVWIKVVHP